MAWTVRPPSPHAARQDYAVTDLPELQAAPTPRYAVTELADCAPSLPRAVIPCRHPDGRRSRGLS